MMSAWNKADTVLVFTAVCFTAALLLCRMFPAMTVSHMFFSVAEAALVGGLADWFAVTALFRKPLGFGWHTALIPRNRERVINGISNAIEKEFLGIEALKSKLAEIRFVSLLTDWLERKNGRRIFRNGFEYFLRYVFERINVQEIVTFLERFLKSRAGKWPLAMQLQDLLAWILRNHRENEVIIYFLDELQVKAECPEARRAILRYLRSCTEDGARDWWQKLALEIGLATDSINLEEAAAALQNESVNLIVQMKDPAHPFRQWLRSRIEEFSQQLGSDQQWRRAIEIWQMKFIHKADFNEVLTALIKVSLQRGQGQILNWTLLQIDQYWDLIQSEPIKVEWLERYCKEVVFRIIETEHHWIGAVARDALAILTDRDFSAFVEDKAGEDLQWIRINGAVVGGLAGLFLFLFSNFVYTPYILPAVQKWLL